MYNSGVDLIAKFKSNLIAWMLKISYVDIDYCLN